MSAGQSQVRKTVLYAGRVQGVGFRYTARSVARGFEVTGYVRNLPDGRVELVAEGAPDQVEGLLEGVQAEMGGHIRERRIIDSPATGEFADFSIRH